ncbi:MAG TPA: hypothetical protein PKL52_11125 [Tenuifilaceae bacterium]|nr:hypothetical protein [Tenuifilaceae bacterium]
MKTFKLFSLTLFLINLVLSPANGSDIPQGSVIKIDHNLLITTKEITENPSLAKEEANILLALLKSLRTDAEYSAEAVSAAIEFVKNNSNTVSGMHVKFGLGYYLSEFSMDFAPHKELFKEIADDSSRLLEEIAEDYPGTWQAKLTKLLPPRSMKILLSRANPKGPINPQAAEIWIAFLREKIPLIREYENITRDKRQRAFDEWLQCPFSEEEARFAIIGGLILLNKKAEAESELRNFQRLFPGSKHLSALLREIK